VPWKYKDGIIFFKGRIYLFPGSSLIRPWEIQDGTNKGFFLKKKKVKKKIKNYEAIKTCLLLAQNEGVLQGVYPPMQGRSKA